MAGTDIRSVIGRNVRRFRAAAALTQEALAGKTGLSSVYLSGIERGRRNPSAIVLAELAQALNVDVRDLLNPTGEDGR